MKRKTLMTCITMVAVLITFCAWHINKSVLQQIQIEMQKDIQIEQIAQELGKNPAYIANTHVRVQNVPSEAQAKYRLKIKVDVLDQESKPVSEDAIAYQVVDEAEELNGNHPVKVYLEIKDHNKINGDVHIEVSANLESTKI